MSNVLSEEKRHQVIALRRLGWPLRRIEKEIGVRRETAGAYLKAAGVAIRPPGAWGRRPPAKPANVVTPDSAAAPPAFSKPANEVTPDSGPPPESGRGPTASSCEPHRAFIEISFSKGLNAKAICQDLVVRLAPPSQYPLPKIAPGIWQGPNAHSGLITQLSSLFEDAAFLSHSAGGRLSVHTPAGQGLAKVLPRVPAGSSPVRTGWESGRHGVPRAGISEGVHVDRYIPNTEYLAPAATVGMWGGAGGPCEPIPRPPPAVCSVPGLPQLQTTGPPFPPTP